MLDAISTASLNVFRLSTVNYIASGSLGAAQGAYGRALARSDDVMPPSFKKSGGKFGKGKGKGFGKRR